MVTMYQMGQLAAFLDGIKAGRTAFPQYVLLEIADIVEPMMYKELRELETQELAKGEQSTQAAQTPNKPTPEEVLAMMCQLDDEGRKDLYCLQLLREANQRMTAEEWNRAADKRLVP